MVVNSPSFEKFKTQLDVVVRNLLLINPLEQEVGLDDIKRPLTTSTF